MYNETRGLVNITVSTQDDESHFFDEESSNKTWNVSC
jgi:hypothetical protein